MPPEESTTFNKSRFRNDLLFLFFVSCLLLLFGWLSVIRVIPINTDLSLVPLGPVASTFFSLWIRSAMVLGLLVPVLVWLFFVRSSDVRTTFGRYLFVLMFQIGTEITLTLALFTSMAVPIGTVYTAFRLCQLRKAVAIIRRSEQLQVTARKLVLGLLAALFVFWLINLTVVLIIIEWPRLLMSA